MREQKEQEAAKVKLEEQKVLLGGADIQNIYIGAGLSLRT